MAQHARNWSTGAAESIRFILLALAVVVLLATAVAVVVLAASEDAARLFPVVQIAAILIGGLTAAGLALALAVALGLQTTRIRQAQLAQTTLDQVQAGILLLQQTPPAPSLPPVVAPPSFPAPRPVAPPPDEAAVTAVNEQMIDLLRQLRDLTLMSPQQRDQWAQRHWERRKEYLIRLVEREISAQQWTAAAQAIQEMQNLLPGDPAVAEMSRRLQEQRQARLQEDLLAARTQLAHLMSITAWPQAEQYASDLRARYPDAPETAQLVADVQREHEAFVRENFQRLLSDLKDATDHRQWRRAVMVAEELLRRYPGDKVVERLQADLPTLRENADAQERREEEALFKDLLHRQRYEESLVVARRLIERFPASASAVELGKLIPKVEELIRQERLKRQQLSARQD